ncbi:hypothetical protein HMPREF9997_01573 [Corynebacterium durum F0235]|uniref:Uncharacterized protein n=1 Tax=Corynebacterium durum F0235 TaxID=1035195 RepID=L1MGI0_9CORY|nr:hypothetical protein HMPREF9997_01573 [Corynebacterium durum F0235]
MAEFSLHIPSLCPFIFDYPCLISPRCGFSVMSLVGKRDYCPPQRAFLCGLWGQR